jgi:hypothetical protein
VIQFRFRLLLIFGPKILVKCVYLLLIKMGAVLLHFRTVVSISLSLYPKLVNSIKLHSAQLAKGHESLLFSSTPLERWAHM